MAQNYQFEAPRLKVNWANSHIDRLLTEIANFLARNPYEFFLQHDAQAGQYHFRGRVRELLPSSIPLIIGDALHNLRSALDILINDAIALGGNVPVREAWFPIYRQPPRSDDALKGALKNGTPAIVALVKGLQPYESEDMTLRQLHDLNILDKHQLLIPTVSATGFSRAALRAGHTIMSAATFGLDPRKLGEQEIGSWPDTSPDSEIGHVYQEFSLTIVNPNSGESYGVSVLEKFSRAVSGVIRKFEKHTGR